MFCNIHLTMVMASNLISIQSVWKSTISISTLRFTFAELDCQKTKHQFECCRIEKKTKQVVNVLKRTNGPVHMQNRVCCQQFESWGCHHNACVLHFNCLLNVFIYGCRFVEPILNLALITIRERKCSSESDRHRGIKRVMEGETYTHNQRMSTHVYPFVD